MTRITHRTVLAALAIILLTATGFAAASTQAGERESLLCSGLAATVGLAMDNRGNLYTADPGTGRVYCLPPGSGPVLLAEVEGTPLSLAVDRLRNVYVGTEEGRVLLISLDGSVYETYRSQARPIGLGIDRDGDILVATDKGDIVRVRRGSLTPTR